MYSCPRRYGAIRTARRARYALALVVALGACAEHPAATRSPPSINLSGYSLGFREGYSDGCESARGVMRRNQKRYSDDAQYAQGWSDGYALCGKR